MHIIAIINIFLISVTIADLILGVILNIKYTEKNRYRSYLIAMFSFWACVMFFVFVKYHIESSSTISYTREIMSAQVLLLGIPCFLSLISYPIVILNAILLDIKSWTKICTPIIGAIALYFAYHYIAGVDPFASYSTYGEMFNSADRVSVILRLALVVMFILYVVRYLVCIWTVVPLYNEYVHDNISNSDYNLDWIRTLVKYIVIVTLCYFALLFFSNPYINFLYIIAVLACFHFIIEMSLFRRSSEHIIPLKFDFDKVNRHWYVVNHNVIKESPTTAKDIKLVATEIDQWMVSETPYINIDFTTADIIKQFPELTTHDLSKIFKLRGETFQSYVRRHRIIKACEITINRREDICPKQIYSEVGFSHYSSFSRSFTTVVGVPPLEFTHYNKSQQIDTLSVLKAE